MHLPITALFLGIFIPIYILLSLKVVHIRRTNKIPLGDGNHPHLTKFISVHSNFNQYIPLSLLAILIGELQGLTPSFLLGIGFSLLIGRLSHAVGIIVSKPGPNLPRSFGMVLTFIPLLIIALANLFVK